MPYVGLQDTYKLVLNGTLAAQTISNVFHYHRSTSGGTASACAAAFIVNVLPSIRDIVSSGVLYTTLDCVNIEDPDDSASVLVNAFGLRGADILSSFNAWGFRLIPTMAAVGMGAKRFAGVTEADVDTGVAVAAQIVRMAVTATKLQTAFSAFLVNYTPAIYSEVGPFDPPIRRVATVASAAYNWMTTQNSRKIG